MGQNGSVRRAAANFFNGNGAQVLAGLPGTEPAVAFQTSVVLPEIIINATNVVNTGTINADASGIINVSGTALNLARGTVHIEGF